MLAKTLILTSMYPTDLPSPNVSAPRRSRRRLTTILHITSLFASVVAISLFAAAIPRWNANFFHNKGPQGGDWTDGMPLGPLAFAFLYHTIALIHARISKTRRASLGSLASLPRRTLLIHAAVSILVLLSLLPSLFLAGYGSLFRLWRPAIRTQSGLVVCTLVNILTPECEPVLYNVGNLQLAGIVFGALVWLSHFALLLVALRNLRRHSLIRQIQDEKLGHFGGGESSRSRRTLSHGSRRGHGSRKGSGRSLSGSGAHLGRYQTHHDQSTLAREGSLPRSGPRAAALAHMGDEREGGPGMIMTDTTRPHQQRQQDLPVHTLQAPERSHPPASRR